MSIDNLDERLGTVFREVFDEDFELRDELTAAAVEGWDSLTYITLIYAVETEFGVQFTQDEMSGLSDVGGLRRCLSAKLDRQRG